MMNNKEFIEDISSTIMLDEDADLNKIREEINKEVDRRIFNRKKPIIEELARRDVVYFAHQMIPEYMEFDTHYKEQLLYLYQAATQKRIIEFINDKKLDVDFLEDYLYLIIGEKTISLLEIIEIGEEPDIGFLIVNIPPRHGKSFLLQVFITWIIGVNKEERIMYSMYALDIASRFSKSIRDNLYKPNEDLMLLSHENQQILYHDIFPDIDVKRGEDTQAAWTVEGGRGTFLATSPKGQITGFGATLMIFDDLIKNADHAFDERQLNKDFEWLSDTAGSREEKGKFGSLKMIISTRWSENDITGKIIESQKRAKPGEETPLLYLSLPAILDEKNKIMLAPNTLSYRDLKKRALTMNKEILEANYNQRIINTGSKMYEYLNLYNKKVLIESGRPLTMISYTDIADTGDDYTVHIIAGIDEENGKAYVLDALYTRKNAEYSEGVISQMNYEYGVRIGYIEANGMGRTVGRNINDILKTKYSYIEDSILPFMQHKNKDSRIYVHSSYVINNVIFPDDYKDNEDMHDVINHLLHFNKRGRNLHDDGADAITGLAEKMIEITGSGVNFNSMKFNEYDNAVPITEDIIGYSGKINL